MNESGEVKALPPFNGPIEIGLRALTLLSEAFPFAYSLQRLVVSDYPLCQASCRLKKYNFEGRRQQWRNVIQKHLLSRH